MTTSTAHQDWNTQIIEEFRANGGKVGGPFAGASMILIHHVGARTGTRRVTPLVYFQDGDDILIAASKAGAPTNPDWYYNITKNPRIDVEVGTETYAVDVHELDPQERAEAWQAVVAANPGFGEYQEKTDRVIPLLRLTRVA